MKKTSNWALLASMFVILSMLVAACGGDNATNTTAPAAAAPTNTTGTGGAVAGFDPSKVKKLDVEPGATLRLSGWSSSPAELKVVSQTVGMFTQVYPNIKVTYEPIPQDFDTKIRAMVQGSTEPDVFYVDPPIVDEMIDAGKLLELTPHMTQLGVAKSDYFDTMINIFSRGAKVYGLPKDFGAIGVFYNSDMASKAGVAPKAGWTWNDYHSFVKALTSGTDPNTKVFGAMHAPQFERWFTFALANGATVLSADGKTATVNSDIVVKTLEWYRSFNDEGIAGTPQDVAAGWAGEALGKGRSAVALEGGWIVPYLADPANGFTIKYDIAPLPVAATGKQGDLLFTNGYGASANTKFPKAAAALALFLAGKEVQGAVLHTGFALPTLKSFKDDPYFQQTDIVAKASKVLYDAAGYGTADYFGPNNGKIHDAMNQATERFFKKTQTAKEALNQAAQEIQDLLK